MEENIEAVVSDKVFEELRHRNTAKKHLEIIERLILDCNKDEVVNIFKHMLLDHDICYQIVSNGKNIEDFYNRIIGIINTMKINESG